LVVKNGSKILARISAGIPGPLSVISRWTRRLAGSDRVVIEIWRRVGLLRIAWWAFATMLTSTWWSWCPSAHSTGRSSARLSETSTLSVRNS
jgi:hypothetical protein